MTKRNITMTTLAIENIKLKPFRSFMLVLLVMLFTFVFFAGNVVSNSLSRGVKSLSNRLGADVMIVPAGQDPHISSVLLSGEPTDNFLPNGALEKMAKLEEVELITPQIFIGTENSQYSDYSIKLLGIDYESDFIIKPWLVKKLNHDIKDDEVIVGSAIKTDTGDLLKIRGKTFKVVAKLEQTGISFDSTVFFNEKVAKEIIIDLKEENPDDISMEDDLATTIMIKLKPGFSSDEVARAITKKYAKEGIFAMFSKKFVNQISSNLSVVSKYIFGMVVVIGLLAIVIISLLFSVILNERKKELAILRVVGANKNMFIKLIINESLIVSIIGALIGVIIGIAAVTISSPFVASKIDLPYLLPSTIKLIAKAVLSFAVGLLSGPLASLSMAIRMSKKDVYTLLREND